MDFNFLDAEDVGWRHRLGKIVLTLTFYADALFRRIASIFWRVNISRWFSMHLFHFPREQRFLALRGLRDEYRALCKDLGVSPDSFHTAKAFYLFDMIRRHLPEPPRSVLELGSGPGLLAAMLLKWSPATRLTLVDLPEMLPTTEKTLSRLAPNAAVSLATPLAAARLPDDSFDLALCIALFHLIPAQQVEDYLALVQRTTKRGGLFFSLNPRKGDNNPLLFPYRPNELLLWEPDEFHENVLQWAPRDSYMLRVERVVK